MRESGGVGQIYGWRRVRWVWKAARQPLRSDVSGPADGRVDKRGPFWRSRHTFAQITMSSGGAPVIDPDADFVYDYHTLRVGGLTFAGVIVFLSILLLAGNSIRRCGKSKPRVREEDD
ncbi:hypothetical protein MATL_G00117960 [Megalops atlanticus]|uniref:FXYD domain-containing ion transport regulator n=1 Tax=Megalops atlanticus TaxID=7932 RepID=A0A9D3Q2E3_MEGAT|nr:hypothetical protein MATL_G00117960 [Megalops atlanticus]